MDFAEVAEKLAKDIRLLCSKSLTGQELAESIDGLGLTDPDRDLCEVAGADDLGRVRCELCPVSEGKPAGCMRLIGKARLDALRTNVRKAKLHLELFAQVLDNVGK